MNGKVMLKGVPYFSDTQVIELTRAEYDALPASKYTDGILYCIKDEGVMKGDTFSPIIYSLAEREVGVWVDGKPLYARTWVSSFTYNSQSSSYSADIENLDSSNFDKVVYSSVQMVSPTVSTNIPYYSSGNDQVFYWYSKTDSKVYIRAITDRTAYNAHTTLYYTKTTDNPGTGKWTTSGVPAHHYSTSEQIVGTWIDGKPLYEKTIVGNTLGNSSTTTTLFTATVEMIHKYDTVLKNASGNVVNSNMLYNGSYHYRVAVDSNGTRMYLTRNDVSVWQDWYPVVTIQYTKITD